MGHVPILPVLKDQKNPKKKFKGFKKNSVKKPFKKRLGMSRIESRAVGVRRSFRSSSAYRSRFNQ